MANKETSSAKSKHSHNKADNKSATIAIKRQPQPAENFVKSFHCVAQNLAMSDAARGLHTRIMSLPPWVQIKAADLYGDGWLANGYGRDKARKIIAELVGHGLAILHTDSEGKGKIERFYEFFWTPQGHRKIAPIYPDFSNLTGNKNGQNSLIFHQTGFQGNEENSGFHQTGFQGNEKTDQKGRFSEKNGQNSLIFHQTGFQGISIKNDPKVKESFSIEGKPSIDSVEVSDVEQGAEPSADITGAQCSNISCDDNETATKDLVKNLPAKFTQAKHPDLLGLVPDVLLKEIFCSGEFATAISTKKGLESWLYAKGGMMKPFDDVSGHTLKLWSLLTGIRRLQDGKTCNDPKIAVFTWVREYVAAEGARSTDNGLQQDLVTCGGVMALQQEGFWNHLNWLAEKYFGDVYREMYGADQEMRKDVEAAACCSLLAMPASSIIHFYANSIKRKSKRKTQNGIIAVNH
jgi:hypothetical protein